MMPIHHAYIPIIAAAAAEVVVGMLWYSDNLFGPMWKKAGGKVANQKDFYQKLATHSVAALVTATALYIAISVFQKTQIGIYTQHGLGQIFSLFLHEGLHNNNTLMSSMKIAGFLWLGFFVPAGVTCTAWSSGNWHKFAIKAGGKLAGLVAMAATIASLS